MVQVGSLVVVKVALVFPVHLVGLVVSASLHLDRRSVSVVIEMVCGKDHHHYPQVYTVCRCMRIIRHGFIWWLR